MIKHLRIIYLLMLLLGMGVHTSTAQTNFASEDDLKKQAVKLFDNEEFEAAFPLYSQLLSNYPKDPNLNFRLGVCMLFAGDDKEKPISFLEYASRKQDVEKEVFYYLAKAYHLNYRFDDAIASFLKYKKVASASKSEKLQVDRQIEMCKNGKQLLRNLSDLVVIDKKEISREDFFRAYDFTGIKGKLLVKPDEKEFKTALDKKKNDHSIIYLSQNNNIVYFSSYGDDAKHGKDIYSIQKNSNGEWGQAQSLGAPINTEYDEDYPFLHPNGKVLYFCSKGHNSMGGFDIFKSTLNPETNKWNEPVNVDFPINTPDDDILYVTDSTEKEAYFSSARLSIAGKTEVYHIDVERKPIDVAIIKGLIVKNRDNQALDAKITIKDLNNSILGIYNANAETGDYVVNLPNAGGSFVFSVESSGFSTQSEVVVLPVQHEFKPMKQEISYETGTDKLIVKNIFDEARDDSNYLLALNFIKQKAKMEISVADNAIAENSKENDTTSELASAKKPDNSSVKTTGNLSNDDIVKIAYNDAKDADTEAKNVREQADIALTLANQKNELAQGKAKEAEQLFADAPKIEDTKKRETLMDEAYAARHEAEQLNQETVTAFNLAKKLDMVATEKQLESDLSQQYAKDLETAVKSKSSKEALAKLDEQAKKLEELGQKKKGADDILSSLKLDESNKKHELDKAIQESENLKKEITDNETLIPSLKADADKSTDDKLKQGLVAQIEGLKKDISVNKSELERNILKIEQLQKEYTGIKNEAALVDNVINQSITGTSETASASVAAIDKNKLEQQVNSIKNASTENNAIASTNTNEIKPIGNINSVNTDSVKNNVAINTTAVVTNTNANAKTSLETLASLNQKYSVNLADAEKITNEADREEIKADVLKRWADDIDADVTKMKQESDSISDPVRKEALVKIIREGDSLSNEKHKLAIASLVQSEVLKKQTTSTIASNVTVSDTAKTAGIKENTTSETALSTNEKFVANMADAEKIINEADREEIKADVLKRWSQEIDVDVAKNKKTLLSTSDTEMQALLSKKISDGESLSKEKQRLADESLAKSELLKKQTVIVANNNIPVKDTITNANTSNSLVIATPTTKDSIKTTNVNTKDSIASGQSFAGSEKFTADIADADKMTNETDRETAKADVLKKWSQSIDSEVEKLKQELNTANDPKTQVWLSKKITDGKALSNQKQIQATESLAKVEKLKQQNTVAGNTTSSNTTANTTVSNTSVVKTMGDSSSIAINNSALSTSEDNKNSNLKTTTPEKYVPFDTIYAQGQMAKVDEITKQADDLMAQSTSLKSQAAGQTNEDAKKDMNEQAEILTKQAEGKKLEAATIVATVNKLEYSSNQVWLDKKVAENSTDMADEISMAEMMSDESKIYFDKAKKLRKTSETAITYNDKETLLEEADNNEKIALEKQKKSKEIYLNYKPAPQLVTVNNTKNNTSLKNDSALVVNPENNSLKTKDSLSGKDTISTTGIIANKNNAQTNTGDETKNTIVKNNIIAISDNKTLTGTVLASNESFALKSGTVYSEKNPIPMNAKMPEGIIFKVQIGAFRNPIPQNLFKGMSPITGETTPKGYIRYSAGLFTKYATADKVKNEIKGMGYKDAFVVAFLNGKRISINEAYAASQGIPSTVLKATANNGSTALTANQQPTTNNQQPTTNGSTPITAGNQQSTPNTQQQSTVSAQNVSVVKGLFYTVQVGVFSQPVSPEKIFNVQPLYSETAPNGNLRYNTGVYNSMNRAIVAKNMVVDVGIKDAYVTAYYNGKRISLSEAKQLETQGNGVFSTSKDNNTLPTFSATPRQNTTINKTKTEQSNTKQDQKKQLENTVVQNSPKPIVSGIVFKVQIGAFNNEVPLEIANKFLEIASEGIKNYKDESGLTIYTIGNYGAYDEAEKMKAKIITQGLSDAFIVAYQNGKKISLDEAKNLLNK